MVRFVLESHSSETITEHRNTGRQFCAYWLIAFGIQYFTVRALQLNFYSLISYRNTYFPDVHTTQKQDLSVQIDVILDILGVRIL